MKKIVSLFIISGIVSFIACGPSAEEKAAAEKARQDSINYVMQQMTADSLAKVTMEKAYADSMAMIMRADSIAKSMETKKSANKAKPKSKEAKKVEEAKKVTGGRGHK